MPIFSVVLEFNRYNELVKTVNTKLICQKLLVHKFAATNNNFLKIAYFRHASLGNVHVYQFSAKSG